MEAELIFISIRYDVTVYPTAREILNFISKCGEANGVVVGGGTGCVVLVVQVGAMMYFPWLGVGRGCVNTHNIHA